MSTHEHAIAPTAKARKGQVDKAGESCVLHPLRMMLKLSTPQERIGKYRKAIELMRRLET
jgi:hypothetical protein